MTAAEFAQLVDGKAAGSGWKGRCPVHGKGDVHPSLSISEGDDGRVLLHCHFPGCEPEDIVGKLGLKMHALFPEEMKPPKPKIVAEYDYTDEGGKLLFQAVRFEPKDFRQRKPDGKGGWTWKLGDVRRVPFRLPKVLKTAKAKGVVYVVEGEKDAMALEALGLTATTNAGGAEKWRPEFAEAFKNCSGVVVLPDNDEPGRKHAQAVARSVHALGVPVKVPALPGLPLKGDVSDWIAAGGTKAALDELVRANPLWAPGNGAAHEDPDEWEGSALKLDEAPATEAPQPNIRFMSGPEFMSAGDTEAKVFVPRVAFEGCCTMAHGRPRSFKSLSSLIGCVEVSAGLPWWGLYAPLRPLRVGLVLEEDNAKLVRQRIAWILAGLGLDRLPETFQILVRSGLYLEAPSERREFLEGVVAPEDLDLLLLDPTRAPFPGVDGGPEKGAPLRRFVREALDVARSVHLIHHDIKPARDQQDERARAEQASGGQILSLADVPMGFRRLSGRSTLVEWSLVKVGPDGPPLRLDFESGTDHDGGFADHLRIVARTADAEDDQDAASRERIRSWLDGNAWKTPTDIATGTGLKRETVDRLLAQMAAAKLLRMETGAAAKSRGRHQNAKLWGPFDE